MPTDLKNYGKNMNRKEFVKNTGLTVASLAILPSGKLFAQSANPKVRLALIGVGLRGQNHLDLVLRRSDVELVAICDIDERMLTKSKEMITNSGKKMPQVYTGDLYAWKKMLEKEKLDAVIISTPWEWHKEMIIGSLDSGIKYVGTEV
ncbi:MAG TPA: Gfo/Idh/MocA family oxidoreductase, partial [Chitinophagaceae bacterium]|nr:Gfo/Idh/MocA family oxidoreductase [Chitinophagaceae bacterium]